MTDKSRGGARERILEAATHLFGEKGYAAISMRDIARRAGVSVGLPYHYWSGKEDLLAAQIRYAARIWEDEMEDRFGGRRYRSISDFVVDYVMFMRDLIREEHPHFFACYLRHVQETNLPHRDLLFERADANLRFFRDVAEQADEHGELRSGVSVDDAVFLLRAAAGTLQQAFDETSPTELPGLEGTDEHALRGALRHYADLFLIGICSRRRTEGRGERTT